MVDLEFKQEIYNTCLNLFNQKVIACNTALKELAEGIANDAKSSAGDKHETARAMMQQEQEKIAIQLKEINAQSDALKNIDINLPSLRVHRGSLVKTNKGYLFLSVAIGKLVINNVPVIALSPQSPLGFRLAGKRTGEVAEMNGISYKILELI